MLVPSHAVVDQDLNAARCGVLLVAVADAAEVVGGTEERVLGVSRVGTGDAAHPVRVDRRAPVRVLAPAASLHVGLPAVRDLCLVTVGERHAHGAATEPTLRARAGGTTELADLANALALDLVAIDRLSSNQKRL